MAASLQNRGFFPFVTPSDNQRLWKVAPQKTAACYSAMEEENQREPSPIPDEHSVIIS